MILALYLILMHKAKKDQSSLLKKILDDDMKRHHDYCFPHVAVQSPKESSFVTLFEFGDDQALITFTGLDHVTNQELYNLFVPVFNTFTPFCQVQMVLT